MKIWRLKFNITYLNRSNDEGQKFEAKSAQTLTVPQNMFALSTGGRIASSQKPEASPPQLRA